MSSIAMDAWLNFLWLGMSAAALAWFARRERTSSYRTRRQHLLAVFLAAVAAFPAVSPTDDVFCFSRLQIPGSDHGAGTAPETPREDGSFQLARHFQTLDHSQVSPFYNVAVSRCFVALSLTPCIASSWRPVIASSGRAPPAA